MEQAPPGRAPQGHRLLRTGGRHRTLLRPRPRGRGRRPQRRSRFTASSPRVRAPAGAGRRRSAPWSWTTRLPEAHVSTGAHPASGSTGTWAGAERAFERALALDGHHVERPHVLRPAPRRHRPRRGGGPALAGRAGERPVLHADERDRGQRAQLRPALRGGAGPLPAGPGAGARPPAEPVLGRDEQRPPRALRGGGRPGREAGRRHRRAQPVLPRAARAWCAAGPDSTTKPGPSSPSCARARSTSTCCPSRSPGCTPASARPSPRSRAWSWPTRRKTRSSSRWPPSASSTPCAAGRASTRSSGSSTSPLH